MVNLTMFAALVLTAMAMYWTLRYFRCRPIAAFAGGLMFGFGEFAGLRFREAKPVIPKTEYDRLIFPAKLYANGAAVRRILQRVGQKIGDDPLHRGCIRQYPG